MKFLDYQELQKILLILMNLTQRTFGSTQRLTRTQNQEIMTLVSGAGGVGLVLRAGGAWPSLRAVGAGMRPRLTVSVQFRVRFPKLKESLQESIQKTLKMNYWQG